MADRYAVFETSKGGTPPLVPVRLRADVSVAERDDLVRALGAVPWERVHHAYGPARDVSVHLYAATLGTAETRAAAWWELWGNVHHQSTVYEATVHAVPFVAAMAGDPKHPDRVQALSFLREVAIGSGEHAPAVREAVRPLAESLLSRAQAEPALVQQALAWLLSAFPSLVPAHPNLERLVPPALREGWAEVLDRVRTRHEDREYYDDAALDRQEEVERWALAGWWSCSDSPSPSPTCARGRRRAWSRWWRARRGPFRRSGT